MDLRTVRLAIAAWEKARLGATGVGRVRTAAQQYGPCTPRKSRETTIHLQISLILKRVLATHRSVACG